LYCNFFSVPKHLVSEQVQEAVVEQTIEQARFFQDLLGYEGAPRTIFMGGGTPSTLAPSNLRRLLAGIRNATFRSTAMNTLRDEAIKGVECEEWTVEANPESINQSFLDTCTGAGVTRISAGVQSTSDERLRILQRSAGRSDILKAAEVLRAGWGRDLNLDFIAGIPGEKPADVVSDLTLLDELPATHVSLYSLTYEPDTPLGRLVQTGEVRANSQEKDEELWFAGVEELQRRGFRQYEVSNFCLPQKECQHNLSYWRLGPYLGVGPSAVSTLPAKPLARALGHPDLAATSEVIRMTTPKDIHDFLGGRRNLWGAQFETVQPKDFLFETLMMGLRLQEGIISDDFRARFGAGFEDLFPDLWDSWVSRGMAMPGSERLALSDSGRMMLDGLLATLPTTRPPSVSWP
jgi:oxygen-independent coproporphyrinogen-3 oxidase